MDTFSLEAIVDEMAEIQTLERKTFEEKIKHSVLIGQLFDAIVSEEQEANQGLTPNSVYDKYEPLLAPIVGKTIMVNECHVLYLAGEANRKRVLKKYREVGLGKDKLKADGSVPLRIDYLATAIRADLDKRWAADGSYVPMSGNAKAGAQHRPRAAQRDFTDGDLARFAQRRREAEVVVTELAEAWGQSFDLRYFTDEELNSLRTALHEETNRRLLGGKVPMV